MLSPSRTAASSPHAQSLCLAAALCVFSACSDGGDGGTGSTAGSGGDRADAGVAGHLGGLGGQVSVGGNPASNSGGALSNTGGGQGPTGGTPGTGAGVSAAGGALNGGNDAGSAGSPAVGFGGGTAGMDNGSGGSQRGGDAGTLDNAGGAPEGGGGTAGSGPGGSAGEGFGGASTAGTGSGGQSGDGGVAGGGSSGSPSVTWPIINGVQWADTDGAPIQAHGGGMLKVGADYYWFGENRNPDGTFYAVSAYRSRDLRQWEHVNDVLTMNSDQGLNPANVERPKVVYNAATQKYVMWMHWENGRDYGEARAAVASSDTVAGDYAYHGSFRPMQDSGVVDHGKPGYMSRDCTLFVDDDGRGYFLSASNENYDLHLYSLSEDYLSIARREALLFEGGHREAPALFKRDGTYFLITSGATGWSPNQAQYATSTSLSSGWSTMRNVADGNTFYSQPTYVLAVTGSEGTEYLYLGDRWAGAWGGRVNDSAYVWQPLSFSNATTLSMSWVNTIEVDTTTGTVSGLVNTFAFINKKSGMAIAVDGPSDQNGADIIQSGQSDANAYVWRLNYDGDGHFRLTNEAGGKVMDVPDESVDPGIHVHLWDDNGGDHQAWRVIDIGLGEFRIRNKKSGHFLGVAGGSTAAGSAVEQQNQSTGDEQIWQVVVTP